MKHNELLMRMTKFFSGDVARIQHFMKVYGYAKMMGEMEGLADEEQKILETASIVHDIGIRISEEKYGDSAGKHQEEEGPEAARKMLDELGYDEGLIRRVCYLVGHHHTYTDIDGEDYQILVEADFLVNLYENGESTETVRTTYERIFRTKSGKALCRAMFAL